MQVYKIGDKHIYNIKLVYVGCPESGKTTNVYEISKRWALKTTPMDTRGERTLFFDFTQKKIFLKGKRVLTISTYSVPGQDQFKPMREMVLRNTDAIIFVADSQESMFEDNVRSLSDIDEIMARVYKRNIADIAFIFQWNKRDLPDAVPAQRLSDTLNSYDFLEYESVANRCEGVVETFVASINLVMKQNEVDVSLTPLDLGLTPKQMEEKRREE